MSKEPSPVKSLRDLMQEEEQRLSENKQESQDLPPASPRAHSSPGKSGCTTNKLKYCDVTFYFTFYFRDKLCYWASLRLGSLRIREFKELQRFLQVKRHIKIEL